MKTKEEKLTNKILKELVIAEAKQLKKNAKPKELNQLNFDTLSSTSFERCIYGQMTGNCMNKRATTLIKESCKRVIEPSTDNKVDGTLNGKPTGTERDRANVTYWSPIEVFIYRNECDAGNKNNNERLVKFLKDETKTLKLK